MPLIAGRAWRDANRAAAYPFADGAALRTIDGRALRPDGWVDACLYPEGDALGLGLVAVVVDGGAATLHLGSPGGGERATVVLDDQTPQDGGGLLVATARDAGGGPCGTLLLEPAAALALRAWPTGRHRFRDGAAEFCVACVIPAGGGLRSLAAPDGPRRAGEVWIAGEAGVQLDWDEAQNRLVVHAVGAPLAALDDCPDLVRAGVGPYLRALRVRWDDGVEVHEHLLDGGPKRAVNLAVAGYVADGVLRITADGDAVTLAAAAPAPPGAAVPPPADEEDPDPEP